MRDEFIGNQSFYSIWEHQDYDKPKKVENLTITYDNLISVLNWSPSTETIYGIPQENLKGYIIYNSHCSNSSQFNFLGFTEQNTYIHQYVNYFSDKNFYKVTAFSGNFSELQNIIDNSSKCFHYKAIHEK